jgi:hypothetical protein
MWTFADNTCPSFQIKILVDVATKLKSLVLVKGSQIYMRRPLFYGLSREFFPTMQLATYTWIFPQQSAGNHLVL